MNYIGKLHHVIQLFEIGVFEGGKSFSLLLKKKKKNLFWWFRGRGMVGRLGDGAQCVVFVWE